MRYSELMELFDGGNKWKAVTDGQNGKTFSFTVNDVPFTMIFRRTSKFLKGKHIWFWSPSFDIRGRDEDDQYKLTGDGDSVAILSTVVDIMRHVINKEHNPNIIFTADEADGSRSALYKRMATTLTRNSQYQVVTEQEPGVTVIMLLNAKTQQELSEEVVVEAPKTAAARFYSEPYGSEKALIYYASMAFGGHPLVKRKQASTSAFEYKYYIKGTNTVVGRSTADGKFYLAQNPNNPEFKPEKDRFAAKDAGKVEPKVEPKAEPKAKPPANKVSADTVLSEIRQAMQRGLTKRWTIFRSSSAKEMGHDNPLTVCFEVRDWGDWEVPPGEEDDGDYDWQQMTQETSNQLRTIITAARAKYPDFNIGVQSGEKNWIYIDVTPK